MEGTTNTGINSDMPQIIADAQAALDMNAIKAVLNKPAYKADIEADGIYEVTLTRITVGKSKKGYDMVTFYLKTIESKYHGASIAPYHQVIMPGRFQAMATEFIQSLNLNCVREYMARNHCLYLTAGDINLLNARIIDEINRDRIGYTLNLSHDYNGYGIFKITDDYSY